MTKDNTLAISNDLSNLGRLQLQSLCVKAGLDSTAENETLKKNLQDHWSQHGQPHSDESSTINPPEVKVPQLNEVENVAPSLVDGDYQRQIVESVTIVEESTTIKQEKDIIENGSIIATDIQTEIKSEESQVDHHHSGDVSMEDTQFILDTEEKVFVKYEAVEETLLPGVSDSALDIKQEQKEVFIKQENIHDEATSTSGTPATQLKVESNPIPISQRKKFWESKSSGRSGLPISKDRLATHPIKSKSLQSQHQHIAQKRPREDDENESSKDIKEEEGQDNGSISNSLPTPGTVRSLIGKFAGSTISPPGTPTGKRRRTEIVKKSPAATAIPVIPRYKRVIKIPAAGKPAAKSAYALGSSSIKVAKRKTTSSSPSSSPAPGSSTTKKTISTETLNRLATPKKVNTGATQGPGHVPPQTSSTTSVPSTPTRPRGPVLSTASRAAQRRNREKK